MPKATRNRWFRMLALLVFVFGAPGAYADLTQTVINTLDSGAGSLRQAIIDSNAASGTSIINFAVVGAGCASGICTITPASALPVITYPVTIDATTQSGYTLTTPKVVISGASASDATGLDITAGNSTVQGLVINGFYKQISLRTNGSNNVQRCFIGVTSGGTTSIFGQNYGIEITSSNNLIGGATSASRNVIGVTHYGIDVRGSNNTISFNYIGINAAGTAALTKKTSYGIYEWGSGTVIGPGNVVSGTSATGITSTSWNAIIIGNYIGTNAAGTAAVPNGFYGISAGGLGPTRIGGTIASERNVISGNTTGYGIYAQGRTVLIQGNYIGTNAAGTAALPNNIGVAAFGYGGIIGGTTAAERNIISGNSTAGIHLESSAGRVPGELVQGNYIGVLADGTTALANGKGIEIALNNQSIPMVIGGTATGAGNVIARNTGRGIEIANDSTLVSIRGNSIHHNGALGIDLGADGVSGNDGAFGATANNGIDYPIFTTVGVIASTLQVAGYVGSAANQSTFANVLVDVYLASDDGNNNGVIVAGDGQNVAHGEGQTYLGTVTTDANGNFSGSFTIASTVIVGDKVTGTATDASGNTSEFGPNITVGVGVITPPASFNCVESGATAATGHLYTKLAGTPFSVDVVALKADNSVETGYAAGVDQSVTVELVDGSGGTACDSRAAVNPAVSQTLTFSAANAGRKASASMTVSKAYADLRCRVTDANQTPNIVACSSDDFAVRPSALSVTSTASADATGVSTSATPRIKTGANFTLTADSAVVGYNGTPAIDTSTLAAHSGAVQAGTLSGSFSSANPATGIATGAAFSYTEVGYFRLGSTGVYDNTFTAVDSAAGDCTNDFSNALVGGQYGCKFGNTSATSYFGRFIPDHFALAPGAATPACGGYSYFVQDGFTTAFSLTAQN
ncbi:DUF6701 domain-containing protein [Propionivibrio sp.]|uniref:DUF6701 domain-containing protein n=1 Tax=Propionivibrio sp. TaxID=2212460 RepID=UPI00260AB7A5|nr:DUF6701 domain-containing protein [Propionivibrio sp.]